MESDLGAYAPLGLHSRVPADRLPAIRAMQAMLAPLGVQYRGNDASGDADVGQLAALGIPVRDLDRRPGVLRLASHRERHVRQGIQRS
jgi:hypothetical protein